MNLNNYEYYQWGYDEVPTPEYKGGGGGEETNKGVSDISGLNFDSASGMLTLSYVKDGKSVEMSTKIDTTLVDAGVSDITSMKLDSKNNLILLFRKDGVTEKISANLDSLEDDIFVEDI